MPDAQETAEMLAALRKTDPEAFAALASGLIASQPVPEERPQTSRVPIYPPGKRTPLHVWPVDVKPWLAVGAALTLHEAIDAEVTADEIATRPADPPLPF